MKGFYSYGMLHDLLSFSSSSVILHPTPASADVLDLSTFTRYIQGQDLMVHSAPVPILAHFAINLITFLLKGMKRPLSPPLPPESDDADASLGNGDVTELESVATDTAQKRERKLQTFTLCGVCNIQLNSAAQAQIHYNGKSHQKRLKKLHNGKMSTSQVYPLLASLQLQGRAMQPALDIKHFLPFRLSSPSPVGLFPNFNTMDPVQKAVINHTFGVTLPPKKKHVISCNVCHLRFNSENQAEAHYKGHKHTRKLKALETLKSKQKATAAKEDNVAQSVPNLDETMSDPEKAEDNPSAPTMEKTEDDSTSLVHVSKMFVTKTAGTKTSATFSCTEATNGRSENGVEASLVPTTEIVGREGSSNVSSAPESEKEGEKTKQHLYCAACKVTVNSVSQLEAHNNGSKHKSVLQGHSRRNRLRLFPRTLYKTKRIGNKGSIGIQSKAFHCNICEIYVNSETQLKQHMTSRRHKERLTGKSSKPKHSPYAKLQQTAVLATKMAFQKHLTKPIATGFLPNPLTAAAVCAMPNLTLRPTTLFQTPFLGPAFFRATPGPLRATHTPFLFAPY
ncbi:zinc finger protein 385D [Narcine bancroftii]|uniref:zinc finger protein 385D n=1 Tax=Narcine bancroftii TaxID=1343680 RepID=UPI0038321F6F